MTGCKEPILQCGDEHREREHDAGLARHIERDP
jgi:hypothetical protein